MPEKYRTVSLPESLIKKRLECVQSGKQGYRNIPDFVIDAVHKRLRELGYLD